MYSRTIYILLALLLVTAGCGSPATQAATPTEQEIEPPLVASPTSDPISTPTNTPLPTNAPMASQPVTTTLDGQTLLQERCTVCHSLDRVASKHKTADQWKTTVERMVGKGAQLNAQERQTLIDYLAQTYP